MKYITTREAAEKWGISERTVISYCEKRLVNDARKADSWFIPENAECQS